MEATVKSEICKICCPSGGALFDLMVPLYDDDFNVVRYGKRCRNCGDFKDYRKSPAKVVAKRDAQHERMKAFEAQCEADGVFA